MSRAFADFFPTAPSVLQEKKKRQAAQQHERRSAHPGPANATLELASDGYSDGLTRSDQALSPLATTGGVTGNGISLDDNESVTEDLPNGIGSASSRMSDESSVFSSTKVQHTDHASSKPPISTTPLTIPSPSPRPSSPKSLLPKSQEHSTLRTQTLAYSEASSRPGIGASNSNTPVVSHASNPFIAGSKGKRIDYDPETDPKISSSDKKRRKPVYVEFNMLVCPKPLKMNVRSPNTN
jgi:histone-lysine N-methyltransferase SETD1